MIRYDYLLLVSSYQGEPSFDQYFVNFHEYILYFFSSGYCSPNRELQKYALFQRSWYMECKGFLILDQTVYLPTLYWVFAQDCQLWILPALYSLSVESGRRTKESTRAVHIVQLGARVDEMVNMTTIAVVDAQEREKKKRKEKSMIGTSDKNG